MGEGYFEIAKNKAIPFIIHTTSIDIKVTGTAFNVKAYPKDLNTVTSLIHGSIEVTIKNKENEKLYMQANDRLIVANELLHPNKDVSTVNKQIANAFILEKIGIINPKLPTSEIAWIENKLIFDDKPLSEILLQMERWYNVSFQIKANVNQQKRLTVDFSKETLTEALEALKATNALDYNIKDNNIIIF